MRNDDKRLVPGVGLTWRELDILDAQLGACVDEPEDAGEDTLCSVCGTTAVTNDWGAHYVTSLAAAVAAYTCGSACAEQVEARRCGRCRYLAPAGGSPCACPNKPGDAAVAG